MKKIYKLFTFLSITSAILLGFIFYQDWRFKNSPLEQKVLEKLTKKSNEIKQKIFLKYKIKPKISIVIEDKLPNNLFGLTGYKKGKIIIYLNKNRFQENESYMIQYVLAHEYAHALMFYFGDFTKENGGHTHKWQQICKNIGGIKCDRFVDHHDILIEKLGGIY